MPLSIAVGLKSGLIEVICVDNKRAEGTGREEVIYRVETAVVRFHHFTGPVIQVLVLVALTPTHRQVAALA